MSIKTVNRILAAALVISLIGLFGSAYYNIWFDHTKTSDNIGLTSALTLLLVFAAGFCNNMLRQ